MSRKRSDESRVLEYFESAPLAKVEVVLELAKTLTKRRSEIDQRILEVKGKSAQPKQRKKRRTKAEMLADAEAAARMETFATSKLKKSTSFEPEEEGQ